MVLGENIVSWVISRGLFRGQWRIAKILTYLLRVEKVMSSYGVWLTPNYDDATFRFCATGHYGNFLKDVIESSPVQSNFIDIGANQGIFSLLAGMHMVHGEVFSIEPQPDIYCLLRKNISFNQLRNVTTLCGAITQEGEKFVGLRFNSKHTGGTSVTDLHESNIHSVTFGPKTFNAIAESTESSFIVKIDVEGFELDVIKAIVSSALVERINGLFIEISREFHSKDTIDEIYKQLAGIGLYEENRSPSPDHYDAYFLRN